VTILEGVLKEELERCERHKAAILAEKKDPNISPERLKQHEETLQRIGKDMRRLKRALEPELPETVKLLPCPICGAEPWIYEDTDDFWVYCSEDCSAPKCAHFDPRHSAYAWNDWAKWYRPGFTFSDLLFKYSGDRNKVKLYKCRFSIIGDGAYYPWPEQDLVATAPEFVEYLDSHVHRWEVVDDCLCAVVGFIRDGFENHY